MRHHRHRLPLLPLLSLLVNVRMFVVEGKASPGGMEEGR